jgi:hypothetical protein
MYYGVDTNGQIMQADHEDGVRAYLPAGDPVFTVASDAETLARQRVDKQMGPVQYAAIHGRVREGHRWPSGGWCDYGCHSTSPHLIPASDVFVTREEADQRAAEQRRDREQQAQKAEAARRSARDEHDRLYDAAMRLAADVDDMDCVEHYCQGHTTRLCDFIDARE